MELLDEVENELNIMCAPITSPISCGKTFKGVYHLHRDETILYATGRGHTIQEVRIIKGLDNPELDNAVGDDLAAQLREELELVMGASHEFDQDLFLQGELTPVFFGTALGNFGVDHMLDGLTEWAPSPMSRQANERVVEASEDKFSGFVFKIQANDWIQNIVTGLLSYADCFRFLSAEHENESCAVREADQYLRCSDVYGG
ncbi:hypothetical protein P4S72_29325 [Vibrio sp. PP-XX7]